MRMTSSPLGDATSAAPSAGTLDVDRHGRSGRSRARGTSGSNMVAAVMGSPVVVGHHQARS